MEFLANLNWVAVVQIILIDILLGGDNAIVIALACRNLPDKLRMKGIVWGTVGAIGIRIALIAFAVTMLQLPFLKLIGGILLLWIGIKLLNEDDEHTDINGSDRLWGAVKTVIVADLVMSLDNVIAIASAAEQAAGEHQLLLVVFGIVVSIPIIVWGSTLVLKLMEKFPVIVTLGAALLGYIAGGMIFSDVAVQGWIEGFIGDTEFVLPGAAVHLSLPGLVGALGVVLTGLTLKRRKQERQKTAA
ncbi:TerC family protein [Herbaspirillum huttiense F1]|jgi:Membrane protein TerC, possibly involved in tellurium resistance|uniref:TerC family protein n=1 Tax=Herbaspirillum huttiense subsp. lycopersici TaxID=3074428 RepID=A0ABU2ERF9_9BURK|nr:MULTISPECIES: TerC family protein [Herbaspirillum]MCO4859010.1 TerC family protein [Herbaspirillum sp. WGmk3]MDR6742202.1 YjbE family integral membrane protein [Herbaspirillum sp. 1173]MDR9850392.1 TerC family protein [Herbaspirillum huttiense SE1]MDT0357671.1 TerC family protein [Herbaspirillum huttiense F1]